MPAQAARRVQIDLSAQQRPQFLLHREESQPRRPVLLELHQHVHVAIGSKVGPQDRTEQHEPSDVIAPAEVGNLFAKKR